MMKQMRENTKWIMLVTALAFVGLMVFEWGMDASGRSSMGVGQIGAVNGDPVMYEDYMATYRSLYDQAQREQDQPVSGQQNRQLEDEAFDEMVNQILIQQQLDRRGIEVTDSEVQQAAQFSPPPQLRQNPAFQNEEGQFDLQRYQDFLATSADNQLLLQLEQYYRSSIPRNKLMRQVTSGIYPSDSDLWELYRNQNEQVRIRLATMDPQTWIPDSEVTVSQEEIEAYYDENQEEFRVPARAQIRIATLPKAPSAADTASARERAVELRREIVEEGAEFAEVARRASADEGTAQEGGDLGTFGRGDLVEPLEEAAFSADEGEVTEPVQTGSGFHLLQVRERSADSVTASHIVVPIERTDDSELQLLIHADSLEAMAETMPLEEAAANLGREVRTVSLNEDFPVAPVAGAIEQGWEWIVDEASPGDASQVWENDQSFYAIELIEYQPEGYRSLEEAGEEIRQQLLLEKKLTRLVERAEELARTAREDGSLEAAAEESELDVREAGPFNRNGAVPGLGRVPAVIGTAFGLSEGEIADPVRAQDRVHLVELVERIPADSTAWLSQVEQQRQQVAAQAQQERLQRWIAGLRENAEIEDRRAEVLQAAEEQQEQQPGFPMGF